MSAPSVSVVIPTLNAESEISRLLDLLADQTLAPAEVLVVDSSSDDGTVAVCAAHVPLVRTHVIDRGDFNHGATRDMALSMTSGEFVCFLTQDAVPVDGDVLANLIAPMLADTSIALVSGRQLPKKGARRFEQLVRGFNYPEQPSVRGASDIARLGIKAYFASDVCAAYRRDAYLACGGFPRTVTNEDMLMACQLMKAGQRVAYEPKARVYHSHNLTVRQQYVRNRAVGASLELNASELDCGSEVGEGIRMVRGISAQLLREGRVGELAAFGVDCAARLLGNRAGRAAARRERAEGEPR
jgi:rhamnosyltransferase